MPRKRPVTNTDCRLHKPELSRPAVRNQDLGNVILEEVALEGLDGITLQALLVRISSRPGFHMTLNDKAKEYVWEVAKRQRQLLIYLLEEARDDFVFHDRRDSVDERGSMFEPVNAPEDVYPYHPIDDFQTRTRGSCKEYYTRRPYTSIAHQLKYDPMLEAYGNRLVFVAPQAFREKLLISADSNLDLGELTVIQYCIMERVARSRYIGEVTRGKVSLSTMKIDPKSSFYQRKLLIKKGLVTKQTVSMKFGPKRISAGVTILHLPKYYTHYETIMKSCISKTIKAIQSAPKKRLETTKLRHDVGKHQLLNILSPECANIFEEVEIPYHLAYPTAFELERVPEKRSKLIQKTVKHVTLRDPRITTLNFASLLITKADDKEETVDTTVPYLPIEFHSAQSSIMHNFVNFVYDSRAMGTSLAELSEKTFATPLDARGAVRLLQRYKVVIPILEDKKKTKMNRYVYFKFKDVNRHYQTVSKPLPSAPSSSVAIVVMEEDAVEGEIIWTVRDLELANEKETAVEDVEEILSTISSDVLKANGSPPLKRKRSSYNHSADAPTTDLKLNPEAARVVEDFLLTCNPEFDEYQATMIMFDLRFTQAEDKDFVPLREADTAKSLVYINPTGWQVLAEYSNIRPDYGRLPSFATKRATDRGNFILEFIYKSRIIIGFQQILRAMRVHEASLVDNCEQKVEVDRRTLCRILAQLQYKQFIQILRVRIQKDGVVKTFALFAPFCVNLESKLVTTCIEQIVAARIVKTRQTWEERKARCARNRLVRRQGKKKSGIPTGILERTRIKARPGTKPGSKILRKVVKGVKYSNKAMVTPKRSRLLDQTDVEALSRVQRVRVDWTSVEDRFLLTSFLASILFIPRYNFQKVFMFNSTQIRDLLHMKVERGRCKTVLAIRRRLHFLMKKQSFYSRYRYYLSEALQDTVLFNTHLKPFHEQKNDKIFFGIPTQCILDVIEYLQKKFQKLSIDPTLVNDSVDAEENFTLGEHLAASELTVYEVFDEISPDKKVCITFHRVEDSLIVDAVDAIPHDTKAISVWTTRTAILSLVMSGDEVANVHRFLQPISDDVLSYTIDAMRLVGITTWQKYMLRFGPSMLLKRKLQASLTTDKYADGSKFLDEFDVTLRKEFPPKEQPPSIGVFYLLCEISSQNLLTFQVTLPDPIITINPKWREVFQTIADGVDNVLSADDDEEFITSDVIEEPRRRKVERSFGNSHGQSSKNITQRSKKPRLESSIASMTPRKRDMVQESCVGSASSIAVSLIEEALRTDTSLSAAKALKMSNKATRLIRSELNSSQATNFVERQVFNVNLPHIETIGDSTGYEQIITRGTSPKLSLSDIKTHLVKVISFPRIVIKGGVEELAKPKKLGRWEQLYDCIASTKEMGISLQFLETKFTRRTLNEGLRFLIIKSSIFLIGVAYRRFVAIEFIHPWTMPVLHANDSLIVQRVVFRPWITTTGRVHWAVLDQTLAAVVGYVNLNPDLSVEALCNHFIPILSPVETMIVVDALVGFEFFNLYSLERKEPKTTAFSNPSLVSKNYTVDTFLDMESLHVELNPLTSSKYSKLQQLFTAEERSELENT